MTKKESDGLIELQNGYNNPLTQVYFRAGLLACREYMARFVEPDNSNIADSIRANWWPTLGPDFGPPRKLDWNELTEGTFGEDDFRCKTADEVSPTQEALPIALGFLEHQHLSGQVFADELAVNPEPYTPAALAAMKTGENDEK